MKKKETPSDASTEAPQNAPAKKYRVLKFGGTSVGSADRLTRAIEIIVRSFREGPIAVVVSAMERTTDRLLEAAEMAAGGDLTGAERIVDEVMDLTTSNGLMILRQFEQQHGKPAHKPSITPTVRELLLPLRQLLYAVSLLREQTAQTLDLVMSFGERLSGAVLTELLVARGIPAVFVDSRDWTVTDDRFGAAMVDQDATRARLAELAAGWDGKAPITTGFLGRTVDGRTTTLGRNGSDYTATMLARWLAAEEVVIWTDVSGVMTADPGIVADAYPLARLSYMEALELVDFGAPMFHPRTMIPLIESGIAMRIRNTMQPDDPGTLIDAQGAEDENSATSVTSIENLALLGVQVRRIAMRAQVSGRVLTALENAGVTIWMASLSAHGQAVAAAVRISDVERATAAIHEELAMELHRGEVEPTDVRQPVTLLTLVAEAMGRTVNVDGRFFQSLGMVGVPIRAIAQGASSRSISCVIDAADTQVAVRTVHAAFNFAHQEVSLLLLGKGTVGGCLLRQIRDERARLERDNEVSLRVVGIGDSARVVFHEEGIDLDKWEEILAAAPARAPGFGDLTPLLDQLRRLPVPILVDCSGADGMEELYEQAFARGIHVVAANKKPLTIPWPDRERLMDAARRSHRGYLYSTTVGASLPVIETLKNLVRTGDHALLIEGSFSGTLGYITNEIMRGVPLSEATRKARELGYTEPNPQDDLSGTDAARKALILSRELGLPLAFADIRVEPLVPAEMLRPMPLAEFYEALKGYDAVIGARLDRLRQENRILRYLARVDPSARPGDGRSLVEVGPLDVPMDHPATRLRGTEAFVAFTTERHHDYPLIVQGAGAGGLVTAAGVLSDILKTSMTLRGR
jgi:aspartokinase/homoserine dehydrogenase 1